MGCFGGAANRSPPETRGLRVERPFERAGGEQVDVGHELFQPHGAALHLLPALGSERPGRIIGLRARKGFPVFRNRVTDDEQSHRTASQAGVRLRAAPVAGTARGGDPAGLS